jgi:hypothetical protein
MSATLAPRNLRSRCHAGSFEAAIMTKREAADPSGTGAPWLRSLHARVLHPPIEPTPAHVGRDAH